MSGIPRGIEVLVKKASVDVRFRQRLLSDRVAAAKDIALELDPAESMMLQAIPQAQLESIIERTTVPDQQKPAFLGKVAAAMLLALGMSLAGCGDAPKTQDVQPERPKNLRPKQGIRPEEWEARQAQRKAMEAKRKAWEKAEKEAEKKTSDDPKPDGKPPESSDTGKSETRKESEPKDERVTHGIRPDRLDAAQGARPDRP